MRDLKLPNHGRGIINVVGGTHYPSLLGMSFLETDGRIRQMYQFVY